MVNKCSVSGCKTLYSKDNVKVRLHRFPLTNPETLPFWIAITGKEKGWIPSKSSRLCGNHFQKSEYLIGHGKNVLKTMSIPTIEYRVDVMKYKKKKSLISCSDSEQTNKHLEVKPVDSNDTNVETVQLNYNDIDNLKYEHQDNGKNYVHEESYYKNDICNRKNQCYMFTSSFMEGIKPIVLIHPEDKPSEESLDMDTDHSITNSNLKKMMVLKLKKKQFTTKEMHSLYFKALKKLKSRKQEQLNNSLNSDAESFVNHIETKMKNLIPFKKTYLTTKQKIQKILMQAQFKIAN